MNHSLDKVHGGYYNYLDRDGSILSPDKAVWLQNRAIWFFSKLYREISRDEKHLEAARLGFDFVKDHCFDKDGSMYFLVNEQGGRLRKRRYWFTESFGVIGFSEYYLATADPVAKQLADSTFALICDLYNHPEKREPKFYPENFKARSLSTPMLLMSTAQVYRTTQSNSNEVDAVIDTCIEDVKMHFLHPEVGALLEMVAIDGSIIDTPEGRNINPGHSIETAWFLMQEGLQRGDSDLVEIGLNIIDWSLDRGWDDEYGGLFSFVDLEGKPSSHVEWDMKYWWPHTETLYALLLAYIVTKDEKYFKFYEEVHEWTFAHFPDYEFGEWFGYLHRDGSVSLPNKGSHWKGTLHIPRLLIKGVQLIDSALK